MAKLLRSYPSQEEVPANLRELYIEQDGKWVLDSEEGESNGNSEDLTKLKNALEQEKEQRRRAIVKLEEIQAKYKDIDPEKALEAQRKLEELEQEKLRAEKNYEELAKRQYAPAIKALEDKISNLTQNWTTEKEARTKAEQTLTRHMIDGSLRDAALNAGVDPEAVSYVLSLTRDQWQLAEGGKTPVILEDDGRPKYGKSPDKILTPEEYYQDLPSQNKVLAKFYKESTGGGVSNGGRISNGAVVLTREEARDHATWQAAYDRAQKAGVPIEVK